MVILIVRIGSFGSDVFWGFGERRGEVIEIAQGLGEGISMKKTTERLARHLGRGGFWGGILEGLLRVQRRALRGCRYLIFDISDIQKNYAKQMEGLATVHDGSASSESKASLGLGYWLANVIGVSADGARIVPAYSELYSLDAEVTSENKKILSAINLQIVLDLAVFFTKLNESKVNFRL